MKYIPILRTKRLTVQLKHLSIGDAIAIARMPSQLEQAECTRFIKAAIESISNGPKDPLDWTVQERALVVTHYLAATSEDGADFRLGESGKYSDYLDGDNDYPGDDSISVATIENDSWKIQHLTGRMAESIERLIGNIDISPHLHWLIGSMAAQLVCDKDGDYPDSEGAYDDWLLKRIKLFLMFPENPFEELLVACEQGRHRLHHLFHYTFDEDSGSIIFLPREGDGLLPPARFPVSACLSEIALVLGRKYDKSG